MHKQTILWTALPNGVVERDGERFLRISVYVSPRLQLSADEGMTLDRFPDWRHWTKTVSDIAGYTITIGGFTTQVRLADPGVLRPALWDSMFNDDTFVKPYEFPDYRDRLIISYPAAGIAHHLQSLYQQAGVLPRGVMQADTDDVGSSDILETLAKMDIRWDKIAARRFRDVLAERTLGSFLTDFSQLSLDNQFSLLDQHVLADDALVSPTQPIQTNPQEDYKRLLLFHTPPEQLFSTEEEDQRAVQRPYPPLPRGEDGFQRYMDFHEAVSMLGTYPLLLRQLGLVLDLEVPQADIPLGALNVQVLPDWTSSSDVESESVSPRTAAIHQRSTTFSNMFLARPRPDGGGMIRNGVLNLDLSDFALVQFDVDGGAIKLMDFARSISSGLFAPDDVYSAVLPALRSAGLSLNLTNRANRLYQHFNQTAQNNNRVEAQQNILLYAEDILRGYRVDIWDSSTKSWHTLCLRDGVYKLEDTVIGMPETVDEGFAQMAMTQQAQTEEDTPPESDDLYLHESLFRWEGWSLVAPRPGKSIPPEGDTNTAPREEPNTPLMPFKLEVNFKAARRSLPRLRFGTEYRMRVRVVDLAGNSLAPGEGGDLGAFPPTRLRPLPYLRYEPLGSPYVLLRKKITMQDAGESLARLVIRSFNDAPDKDALLSSDINERHIAPPPTTQLMAETHAVFDDPQGRLKNDSTTYALIAARDNPVDLSQTETPVIPQAQMPITYLPDPLAVGAALRDLPGAPEGMIGRVSSNGAFEFAAVPGILVRPGSVVQIPFTGNGGPISAPFPPGLQALYLFNEGEGSLVRDVSGVGTPLDLTIADPGNVTWGSGRLTVNAATIIASSVPAVKITSACRSTNEVSVEAWVEPANTVQSGPARIVALSEDQGDRNFTLGQGLWGEQPSNVFDFRVRTHSTDANGRPSLTTPTGFATTALTHIVCTRRADGTRTIYVNGAVATSDISTGTFTPWNDAFYLALANEFVAPRAWLGSYHLVAVYNRALTSEEVQTRFTSGAGISSPVPDLLERMLNAASFRLALTEHADGFTAPHWNAAERVLTVYLPKAEEMHFSLSTYMSADDLRLMGVWNWLREYLDGEVRQALTDPDRLESLAHHTVNLAQYALEGGHEMLTPARQIVLVHAVQQPIGVPYVCELTAQRKLNETLARLMGEIRVHGKSTVKIDLLAAWQEPVDDLNVPGPDLRSVQAHAAEVPISTLYGGTIYQHGRSVANYDSQADALKFISYAYPVHEFRDTKHRIVQYTVTATSRYKEYFAGDVPGGFTRSSEPTLVNVPNTARPAAPLVRYILPTYGWKRETTTNLIGSYRRGGGLRVYLERPWYSSGEGELLGVVLWQGGSLTDEQREKLKPFISQIGVDPLWGSAPTSTMLASYHFTNEMTNMSYLHLPEVDAVEVPIENKRLGVVGHNVGYDPERRLWYCDIEIDPGDSYTPFVRLALARFQPDSVEGAHLSQIVLADFAQLAPNRAAILTYDPYEPGAIDLVISGFTYRQSADLQGNPVADGSFFVISVEKRDPDIMGDLGWIEDASIVITPTNTSDIDQVLWKGQLALPATREPGQYRVVIREYEELYGRQRLVFQVPSRRRFRAGGMRGSFYILPSIATEIPVRRRRLVYADTLEL